MYRAVHVKWPALPKEDQGSFYWFRRGLHHTVDTADTLFSQTSRRSRTVSQVARLQKQARCAPHALGSGVVFAVDNSCECAACTVLWRILQTAVEGQEPQLCGNAAATQLESEDFFSFFYSAKLTFVIFPSCVVLLLTNKGFLYRTTYAVVALLGVFVR